MDARVRPGLADQKPYRDFGLGLSIVLSLFGAWAWWKTGSWARWQFGAAAAALAFAWAAPLVYRPVYRVWMPVALWLGRVNSVLILGAIYYAILTPYAWLLRLCGVRLLELGRKDGESYWKPHASRDPARAMRRQF